MHMREIRSKKDIEQMIDIAREDMLSGFRMREKAEKTTNEEDKKEIEQGSGLYFIQYWLMLLEISAEPLLDYDNALKEKYKELQEEYLKSIN